MTLCRGKRRFSAALFSAAFLLLAAAFPALADPLPVPRFESADCPFEVPRDVSVRFGRLVVPENRSAAPGGRTVSIAVLVLKSRSGTPAPDPVLYLEGGPGAPSVAYWEDWIGSPILDRRDIILFDQRGVGLSVPALYCPEIQSARLSVLDPAQDPSGTAQSMIEAARSCAARFRKDGIDLGAFNTAESARDLAALRQVLGIRQWNLYGISYGTRLALRLLQEDREGVRSVVLDSVLDPAEDEYGSAPGKAREAFERFLSAVSADPEARRAFPGLRDRFVETAENLDKAARSVRIRLPGGRAAEARIGGVDLFDAVYSFLYDADSIPYLPLFVEAVSRGDDRYLVPFLEEALYDDLADGLYYALQGHDEAPFSASGDLPGAYDPQRLEREMALAFETGRADGAANAPVSSDVPALVLAGGFDPITPAGDSERVAGRLSNAAFLLFPGLGHAASMSPGPENLVAAFLENPSGKLETGDLPENRVRPFATRLFMTPVPYRFYSRLGYGRDLGTRFSVFAFFGIFLLGSLSLGWTWRDRRRPGASRWGVVSRLAGGAGALLEGGFMAGFALAVVFVNRTDPALLFFGLPPWAALLAWLPRLALPAGVLLLAGLPAIFRDGGMTRRSRVFYAVLAAAQALFTLSLAGLKLI